MGDSSDWGPTADWIWFFIPSFIMFLGMILSPFIVGIVLLYQWFQKRRKK